MALQFPLQFKRQYSGPLDVDQVFATIADKNAYLNNPLRYAGMAITCLEEEGKLFILNNALTSWIELSVDLSGYVTTDNLEVLALLKANVIPLLSLSPESPISPEVNDCFYQEDVKTIFKWNGTSWLPIVDPEDYLYQYNGKQYKWNSALGLVGVGVGLSTNDYTDTDKQALANKVDKETGKGLSTNDYNDTEANKFALKDNLVNTFTGATVDQFPNALLVKNELESLTTQITRVYKPMGELQAIDIKPSLLDADHLGFVYNINGDFVTTTDFIEGAGKTHSSGSNIVIIEITGTYMFDVMSGMIDLSGYVEKETGKGLSANDFTTTLKNKLDGAEETSNKVNTLEDATVDKYPNALLVKNIIETLNSGLASVQNLSPFVYKGLIGTSYATSMNDILKTYEQYDSINSYWQFRPIKGSVYICNADIVFPLNEIYNWVGVAKNSQTAYSTSEHGVGTDITTLTLKKGDALVITDFFYNPDAPYDISAYIKLERNIDTSVFVQKDGAKVLSTNDYTTNEQTKVSKIITTGDGTKMLSDDGTYKSGGTGIELKAIGSAPTPATSGDYYYNTTDKKIYKYDTSWSEWLGE